MKFVSTRIITAGVKRLVDFYEIVAEVAAVWENEPFAEIPTQVGALAIGRDKTIPLFGNGSAEPAANRSATLAFIVEDVDAEYERRRQRLVEVVTRSREASSLVCQQPDKRGMKWLAELWKFRRRENGWYSPTAGMTPTVV